MESEYDYFVSKNKTTVCPDCGHTQPLEDILMNEIEFVCELATWWMDYQYQRYKSEMKQEYAPDDIPF